MHLPKSARLRRRCSPQYGNGRPSVGLWPGVVPDFEIVHNRVADVYDTRVKSPFVVRNIGSPREMPYGDSANSANYYNENPRSGATHPLRQHTSPFLMLEIISVSRLRTGRPRGTEGSRLMQ